MSSAAGAQAVGATAANNSSNNNASIGPMAGVKVWVKRSKALSTFDLREAALKQQESVIRTSYENQVGQVNRSEQELLIREAAVKEQRALLDAWKAWDEKRRMLLLERSAELVKAQREKEAREQLLKEQQVQQQRWEQEQLLLQQQQQQQQQQHQQQQQQHQSDAQSERSGYHTGLESEDSKQLPPFHPRHQSIGDSTTTSKFSEILDQEDGVSMVMPSLSTSITAAPLRISRRTNVGATRPALANTQAEESTSTSVEVSHSESVQSESELSTGAPVVTFGTTLNTLEEQPEDDDEVGALRLQAERSQTRVSDSESSLLVVPTTTRELADTTQETQLLELELAANQAELAEAEPDLGLQATDAPEAQVSSPRPITPAKKITFPMWASVWFQLQLIMASNQVLLEDVMLAVSPFERKLRVIENLIAETGITFSVKYEFAFDEILGFSELSSKPVAGSTSSTPVDHSAKFAMRLKNRPESQSMLIFRTTSEKERDALVRFLQAGPLQNIFEVASFEFRYPDLTNEADPSLQQFDVDNVSASPGTTERRPSVGRRPSVSAAANLASPRASMCAATNYSTWLRPRGFLDPNLWNESVPPFQAILDVSPIPDCVLPVIGVLHKWRLTFYPFDAIRLEVLNRPNEDPALVPGDQAMEKWTDHERRLMFMARTTVPLFSFYLTGLTEEDENNVSQMLTPDSEFVQRITAFDEPGSVFDPNTCLFYNYSYTDNEPEKPTSSPVKTSSTLKVKVRLLPVPGHEDAVATANQIGYYVSALAARGRSRKVSQVVGDGESKQPELPRSPSTPKVTFQSSSVAVSPVRTYAQPAAEAGTPTIESLGDKRGAKVRHFSLK